MIRNDNNMDGRKNIVVVVEEEEEEECKKKKKEQVGFDQDDGWRRASPGDWSLIPKLGDPKWKRRFVTNDIKPKKVSEASLSSDRCDVCQEQISRYVCPTCEIPYCSVTCYRQHNTNCTESFYKQKVLQTQQQQQQQQQQQLDQQQQLRLSTPPSENLEEWEELAQELALHGTDEWDTIFSMYPPSAQQQLMSHFQQSLPPYHPFWLPQYKSHDEAVVDDDTDGEIPDHENWETDIRDIVPFHQIMPHRRDDAASLQLQYNACEILYWTASTLRQMNDHNVFASSSYSMMDAAQFLCSSSLVFQSTTNGNKQKSSFTKFDTIPKVFYHCSTSTANETNRYHYSIINKATTNKHTSNVPNSPSKDDNDCNNSLLESHMVLVKDVWYMVAEKRTVLKVLLNTKQIIQFAAKQHKKKHNKKRMLLLLMKKCDFYLSWCQQCWTSHLSQTIQSDIQQWMIDWTDDIYPSLQHDIQQDTLLPQSITHSKKLSLQQMTTTKMIPISNHHHHHHHHHDIQRTAITPSERKEQSECSMKVSSTRRFSKQLVQHK